MANGLPLWGGQQLAVDTTLVSPLSGQGQPVRRGGQVAGAALAVARRRKERAYLVRAHRCRLVVLAVEVGGRWSDEAASFIRSLARARALEAPARLRPHDSLCFVPLPGRSFAMPGVAPCLPSTPCWLILPTCHWRAHPACPAGEPHSREPPVYKWLPP